MHCNESLIADLISSIIKNHIDQALMLVPEVQKTPGHHLTAPGHADPQTPLLAYHKTLLSGTAASSLRRLTHKHHREHYS